MFERFTDRARRVVVLAQEEARMLNHNYIGPEHLLLGLMREGEGVAAKALESLNISLEAVRSQVEEIIGQGQAAPTGHIPFTPRAKKVLELSLREALQLGHNYIGTEHILLGLIREGEGAAAQVLLRLGANLNRARQSVIDLIGVLPEQAEEPLLPVGYPGGRRSESAVRVLRLAGEAASDLGSDTVDATHLLLGLIASGDPDVDRLLRQWDIEPDDIRRRIEELTEQEVAAEEASEDEPPPRD
jgi:ATP-dependent Clp protease ATP-binding subunit ClpA